MNKFKVGDKVKRIENVNGYYENIKVDEVYTVSQAANGNIKIGNIDWWWSEEFFILHRFDKNHKSKFIKLNINF